MIHSSVEKNTKKHDPWVQHDLPMLCCSNQWLCYWILKMKLISRIEFNRCELLMYIVYLHMFSSWGWLLKMGHCHLYNSLGCTATIGTHSQITINKNKVPDGYCLGSYAHVKIIFWYFWITVFIIWLFSVWRECIVVTGSVIIISADEET